MPGVVTCEGDLDKLKNMNNMLTGEFDQVLFAGSGEAEVVDAVNGIVIPPKNVTELDRLSYIIN